MFKATNTKAGLALESPDADFIPYACHYLPDTLLTKNGELMKVLKITGFMQEQVGAKHQDVREVLRGAIQKHIPDASFAMWIHTIRRKKDMSLKARSTNVFSQKISDEWESKHSWKSSYVNEIYLTVIKESAPFKIKNIKQLFRSLSFKSLNNWHERFLAGSNQQLDEVVHKIKADLEVFGVKKLSLVAFKGAYYSEPLQFLSKILSLADSPVPLMPVNLSEELSSYKVAFGFNVLEVVSAVGKRFASILTLKEYHELALTELDKFLQLPQEFIITQTLDFINSKQALEHYRKQAYVLNASGDAKFYEISGLKNIIDGGEGRKNAYGESQMTVMLLNSELQGLENDIDSAYKVLSALGMNATRRDLRMEECYWANLPANFSFVTRRKPINTNRFAGMISLSSEEFGAKDGNKWGEAITTFRTMANTPFFFSFHLGDGGHTAIMGPKKSGKKTLLHFLLSQSSKVNPKIFYFGCSNKMSKFTEAMEGKHHQINRENGGENPFSLAATQENLSFFFKWLTLLIGKRLHDLDENEKKLLQQAAKFLLKLPPEQRSLLKLLPGIKKAGNTSIYTSLERWADKEYGEWIAKSNVDLSSNNFHSFDVSALLHFKDVLSPILHVILHKIESELTGKPTIIVFDEAWDILNHPSFMPDLSFILDKFAAKNAIFVFSTENVADSNASLIPKEVALKVTTKIFTPNKDAEKYSQSYMKIWDLSDAEFEKLVEMQVTKQQFMIKTEENSIVLKGDFRDVDSLISLMK